MKHSPCHLIMSTLCWCFCTFSKARPPEIDLSENILKEYVFTGQPKCWHVYVKGTLLRLFQNLPEASWKLYESVRKYMLEYSFVLVVSSNAWFSKPLQMTNNSGSIHTITKYPFVFLHLVHMIQMKKPDDRQWDWRFALPWKLVGNIHLRDKAQTWMSHTHFSTNQTVVFQLDHPLRLNVTFYHIYFSAEINPNCSVAHLSVTSFVSNDTFRLTFCGTHSNMNMFPPSNVLVIHQLIFQPPEVRRQFCNTRFSYTVIDKSRIASLQLPAQLPLTCCVLLPQTSLIVVTISLLVRKLDKIAIKWKCHNWHLLNIHDGPGMKSHLLHSIATLGTKQAFTATTQTFQAVVIFLQTMSLRVSTDWLKYSEISQETHADHWLDSVSSTTVHFPNTFECTSPTRTLCVVKATALKDHQLNVTVVRMDENGDVNTVDCSLRGVTIFAHIQSLSTEDTVTHCPKPRFEIFGSDQDMYHKYYAPVSGVVLLFYAYKEYGNISVDLLLSSTKCKVAPVNICHKTLNQNMNWTIPGVLHIQSHTTPDHPGVGDVHRMKMSLHVDQCVILQFHHGNHSASKCRWTRLEVLGENGKSMRHDTSVSGFFRGKKTSPLRKSKSATRLCFTFVCTATWCLGCPRTFLLSYTLVHENDLICYFLSTPMKPNVCPSVSLDSISKHPVVDNTKTPVVTKQKQGFHSFWPREGQTFFGYFYPIVWC